MQLITAGQLSNALKTALSPLLSSPPPTAHLIASLTEKQKAQSSSSMASYYQEPHFLEACYLCRRPLSFNSDIYMYRGDTPFCSKECREEQIEMDEAKEKSLKMSARSALRKPSETKDSSSAKAVRRSTLIVA